MCLQQQRESPAQKHATASRAWWIVRLNFERLQREPGNDNVATDFGPQGLLWRFLTLANYQTNYLQRRPEEETLDAASTGTIPAPPCPPVCSDSSNLNADALLTEVELCVASFPVKTLLRPSLPWEAFCNVFIGGACGILQITGLNRRKTSYACC